MKCIGKAVIQFAIEIWNDFMLIAMLIVPILTGIVFHYLVPIIEVYLCKQFSMTSILSPYYLLFDLLLGAMTPLMFAFSGVMVILGEIDNEISRYMAVTPLGKSGYLISRIGIPSVIAVIYDIILLMFLSLTELSLNMSISLSILCGLISIFTSMVVVTFATNKVEGLAITKLTGLFIVGLPVAFFVTEPIQYIGGILPSFWIAKFAQTGSIIFIIPFVIVLFLWLTLIYHKFIRKIL